MNNENYSKNPIDSFSMDRPFTEVDYHDFYLYHIDHLILQKASEETLQAMEFYFGELTKPQTFDTDLIITMDHLELLDKLDKNGYYYEILPYISNILHINKNTYPDNYDEEYEEYEEYEDLAYEESESNFESKIENLLNLLNDQELIPIDKVKIFNKVLSNLSTHKNLSNKKEFKPISHIEAVELLSLIEFTKALLKTNLQRYLKDTEDKIYYDLAVWSLINNKKYLDQTKKGK